jgi:phosphoribosylformimino-5-aminoimidazole carboxamide ribotide isomerase
MLVVPAIDLRGGRCVRLTRGDYARETVYSSDPVATARKFRDQGANRLHIIDLDGAKAGEPRNLAVASLAARETGLPVQYGGGIRSLPVLARVMESGIRWAIVGTAAFRDPAFLEEAATKWGDRILVAVDVRAGTAMGDGWTSSLGVPVVEAVGRLKGLGIGAAIVTDTERDGTLEGLDLKPVGAVLEAARGVPVFLAGGVRDLKDIVALKPFTSRGLAGVVAGKALYEGTLDLVAAIAAAQEGQPTPYAPPSAGGASAANRA